MTPYRLRFHTLALQEWQQLDASVRTPLKKKLAERLALPRVPAAALHGLPNCYKIKLHSVGYRLVYRVDDDEIFVTVIAAGRRDKSKVYQAAAQRLN
ncbi:type II toxin-antitoxin system RelE/ParE family toxin [Rhodoferax sp.]|uniref:type II toxin-antitoxin system RelE family toxin n=1 Tax=Rhodoferax sp. TaxID=50421 RepID=UPI00261DB3CF|nr:type II toxin-antitoxin system RelE/ParE family toxin [Rhodoferax sp.]MDD2811390.1 type II toxin-antitoxin system RelE/ParE family toxin [Rhodoferax sp.]MDD4944817.1 type II toxin-antitoxin system RelE/ParE family toxin [Rhodoferax sp.]MDD5478962.1 type II toxin-antitoxin system RelE/ParE family toxin [Rhodoferax sp.]